MAKTYRNIQTDADGVISGEYQDKRYSESWIKFSGLPALMRIAHVRENGTLEERQIADRAFWQRQDGYGRKGYTPPQGRDWSGIRDSSDEAIAEMDEVARNLHPGPFPWEVAAARERLVHEGDALYGSPRA